MLTTMIGRVSEIATTNLRRSIANAAACARCSRSSRRPSARPLPSAWSEAEPTRASMTS